VNPLGLSFSHGPQAGEFPFESDASLPKSRAKQPRKSPEERAGEHGLSLEELGVLDSDVLLSFLWKAAGRPEEAASGWRRERPLVIVLDNYSVHKCDAVQEALPVLAAANIQLFYLPAYCPELSRIEPIWQDVKHHQMPVRSYVKLGDLKRAVDETLARKAAQLRIAAHAN
jgi:hypothetical protein